MSKAVDTVHIICTYNMHMKKQKLCVYISIQSQNMHTLDAEILWLYNSILHLNRTVLTHGVGGLHTTLSRTNLYWTFLHKVWNLGKSKLRINMHLVILWSWRWFLSHWVQNPHQQSLLFFCCPTPDPYVQG